MFVTLNVGETEPLAEPDCVRDAFADVDAPPEAVIGLLDAEPEYDVECDDDGVVFGDAVDDKLALIDAVYV